MAELCKKCGKNEGQTYTFFYGNLESESTLSEKTNVIGYTTRNVIKKYSIGGSQSDFICDACISKRKALSTFGGLGGGIPLLVGVIIIFYLIFSNKLSGIWPVVICVNTIGLMAAIYLLGLGTKGVKQNRQEFGEEIAIQLNKKSLESKYKEFWTATKYLEMQTGIK